MKGAAAVIFVTPEYNGSVSGALKNAYDWISRDYSKQGGETPPIAGKKCGTGKNISGIISASYISKNQIEDVKKIGEYLKLQFAPNDYYVSLSQKGVFNEQGELISEDEKRKLKQWLAQFILFVSPNSKVAVR